MTSKKEHVFSEKFIKFMKDPEIKDDFLMYTLQYGEYIEQIRLTREAEAKERGITYAEYMKSLNAQHEKNVKDGFFDRARSSLFPHGQ